MKFSSLYIRLCDKAQDKIKAERTQYYIGDCVYSSARGVMTIVEANPTEAGTEYRAARYVDEEYVNEYFGEENKTFIWLPRLDQLALMIETWNKQYSTPFFQNIVSNSEYRGIQRNSPYGLCVHLLIFYMSDKHMLSWDDKTETWAKPTAHKFEFNAEEPEGEGGL